MHIVPSRKKVVCAQEQLFILCSNAGITLGTAVLVCLLNINQKAKLFIFYWFFLL